MACHGPMNDNGRLHGVDHAGDGPAGESTDPLGDRMSDSTDDILADVSRLSVRDPEAK
jgi:hypothetical protein